jgi:hypothetical protein
MRCKARAQTRSHFQRELSEQFRSRFSRQRRRKVRAASFFFFFLTERPGFPPSSLSDESRKLHVAFFFLFSLNSSLR